jgi:hypothetical protein
MKWRLERLGLYNVKLSLNLFIWCWGYALDREDRVGMADLLPGKEGNE